MRRVYVKNGRLGVTWRNRHVFGKTPRPREERKGTIMVYKVDAKQLDPKADSDS